MSKLKTFIQLYSSIMGWSETLNTITIFPTDKCNLNCFMCWRYNKPTYDELEWSVLSTLLSNAKTKVIDFTGGGEPLMYPHIKQAMQVVKARALVGSLTTNGTLLHNFSSFLSQIMWNQVTLSLDGPEDVHDKIRGVLGAFRSATSSFNKLEVKHKTITCTISSLNCDKLSSLIHIAEDIGASYVNFNPQYPYQNIASLEEESSKKALEQLQIASDISKSVGLKTNASMFTKETLMWVNCNPTFCVNPFTSAVVDARGNVRSCCVLEEPIMGNIYRQSFQDIWCGESYQKIRALSRERRMYEICKYCNTEALATNKRINSLLFRST